MSISEIVPVTPVVALQKIDEVLKLDPVDRHSFFQLKYFVINKEPTHQSKLWRCVREISSRKDAIEAILLELDEQKDQLELAGIEEARLHGKPSAFGIEPPDDELYQREKEIKLRQVNRKKDSIQKNIHNLEVRLKYAQEEALFFVEAFKSLEKKEEIKPFDDLESQKEYWNEKFKHKFRLSSILGFRPDLDLVETILTLNDDAPVKREIVGMIAEIQNRALTAARERPQQQKALTPLPEEPLTLSTVDKERNAN